MDFLIEWLPTIISVILIIGIFAGKNWTKARIEGSIRNEFDEKLEIVKSELRSREAEISTLRDSLLGGRANRQALLDKRRLEAVEKVWTAVNDLAQLKTLSRTMAILNFSAVAREVDNPKMQTFLHVIEATVPDPKTLKNVGRDERPFLPELAWAYFSAYTAILYGSLTQFFALKNGLKNADKYLTSEPIRKILNAALPHQTKFIEESEQESYHYLLEEIEGRLLEELRKILEGKEAARTEAELAKGIMAAVRDADEEGTKQTVQIKLKDDR